MLHWHRTQPSISINTSISYWQNLETSIAGSAFCWLSFPRRRAGGGSAPRRPGVELSPGGKKPVWRRSPRRPCCTQLHRYNPSILEDAAHLCTGKMMVCCRKFDCYRIPGLSAM